MAGVFKLLKIDFQVDGRWEGRSLAASLQVFQAVTGAGGSTACQSAMACMGAKAAWVGEARDQVQAVRLTMEVATGRWQVTWDRTAVEFVNEATGELQVRAVRSEAGQESAGAHLLGLIGLPVEESARGAVTVEAALPLLFLTEDRASTAQVGGMIAGRDRSATWEILFGLLDGTELRLRSLAAQTAAVERAARTRLAKLQLTRREHGLPSLGDLRARRREHHVASEQAREQEQRQEHAEQEATAALTALQEEARTAQTRLDEADRCVQDRVKALGSLYEEQGRARQRLASLREDAEGPAHCPQCSQPLPRRDTGRCSLCAQHDDTADQRTQRLHDAVEAAGRAAATAERAVTRAHAAHHDALAARQEAAAAMRKALEAVDTCRTTRLAPAAAARVAAAAQRREAELLLAAVDELFKELRELQETEEAIGRHTEAADHAKQQWHTALDQVADRRHTLAKELTAIFAPLLKKMTSQVHDAYIEPDTFTPRVNGHPARDIAHFAGLLNLIHLAWHLTLFTAARTMPHLALPAFVWLDSPLDGVGGGEQGEQHVRAALSAIAEVAEAAGDDGQIILTTPHPLPRVPAHTRTTVLDVPASFVPHLTPAFAAGAVPKGRRPLEDPYDASGGQNDGEDRTAERSAMSGSPASAGCA